MSDEEDPAILMLECDPTVGNAFADELEAAGAEHTVTERSNLSGAVEVIVEVLKAVTGPLATLVVGWFQTRGTKGVQRIKLGELEIENPTPEQVAEIVAAWKDGRKKRTGKTK